MTSQQTSLLAYTEISRGSQLGRLQRLVYQTLARLGEATNLEIAQELNIPINTIVPRIYELRQKGLVIEAKQGIGRFSPKKAIFWRVA